MGQRHHLRRGYRRCPRASDVGTATPGAAHGQRALENLERGITYHYRIVAKNITGITFGNDQSFSTPQPPSITSFSSTNVTARQRRTDRDRQPERLRNDLLLRIRDDARLWVESADSRRRGTARRQRGRKRRRADLRPGRNDVPLPARGDQRMGIHGPPRTSRSTSSPRRLPQRHPAPADGGRLSAGLPRLRARLRGAGRWSRALLRRPHVPLRIQPRQVRLLGAVELDPGGRENR